MSNKPLLVTERAETQLTVSQNYVLEGVFTEFGVKNKNGRIYEAKAIMPHIEELRKKIAKGSLVGELDHPKTFDVTYKNASHVIESLEFDEEKQQIIGRIRLLNTTNGKEARALCDDGIPLHISSRSAGVVEANGRVNIKKMFTYDLVADPGFENAQLERCNESYGLGSDSSVSLFELSDEETLKLRKVLRMDDEVSESATPASDEYISREQFNKYTQVTKKFLEEKIGKLEEALAAKSSEAGSATPKELTEAIAKIDAIVAENETTKKTLARLIHHNDYIVEHLEKVSNYSELISRTINEEAADKAELIKVREYAKVIAEDVNKTSLYLESVAIELNERFEYQDGVNKNVDGLIAYGEALSENLESKGRYLDYIRTGLNNLGEAVDAIHGEAKTQDEPAVANEPVQVEETAAAEVPAAETPAEESTQQQSDDAIQQVDAIVAESKSSMAAKEHEAAKPSFYLFLSKERRQEFDSMEPDQRDAIVEGFKSKKYFGSVDVARIWESVISPQETGLNWLSDAPKKYKAIWESLNAPQKNAIRAQASVRQLDTEYRINDFWSTRDLRPSSLIEESNSDISIDAKEAKYSTDNAWMETVRAGFRKRRDA